MNINLSVNRNWGYEKATPFNFTISPEPLSSVKFVKWFFDDGKNSNIFNPSHIYLNEGTYNPYVYVYTNTGLVSATLNIYVQPFIDESIYFDFTPPPTFEGHYNRYPFRIHITSKTTEPHFVDLSAMFSRSYKHQEVESKWGFLRPEWRFLDVDGNIIDRIQTEDQLLKIDEHGNFDPNGTVVGVTGKAEFYFIDDIYNIDRFLNKENYTTLIATLQTEKTPAKKDYKLKQSSFYGYGNSKATAFFPYIINIRPPEALKITENGIFEHSNPRWSNLKFPLVISPTVSSNFSEFWIDGNTASKKYKNSQFFLKSYPISDYKIPINYDFTNINYDISPLPVEFKYTDETSYKVSGYYKGTIDINSISALNCVLSADSNIPIPDLSAIYLYPILWCSNPASKTINTAQYFFQTNFAAASTVNLDKAQIFTFGIPIVEDNKNLALAVSGFHGVYSIAVSPFPDYHAWLSDSEKNYLYRYSTHGEMLCSIDINRVVDKNKLGFLVKSQVSPSCLTIDSERNIWLTLYDTISTLKFDPYGNFLFAVTPISHTGYDIPPNINSVWFENTQYYPSNSNETGDNNFIEPTGIDADVNDNVWVTYSYFGSGYLVKYDKNGILLNTISLPLCSCPQEVVCDKNENVWLVNSNLIWGNLGSIEKRDTNGNLISSYGNIRQPNHATIDKNQSLWFTFDYNKVGKIDSNDQFLHAIDLSSKDIFSPADPSYWFYPNENTDDNVFEGISTDYRGNIYVINSLENQIYVLDQNTMAYKDRFMVNPQGMHYSVEDSFNHTTEKYNPLIKSLQAQGDWSGLRWIIKYGDKMLTYFNASSSLNVQGYTKELNFYNELPYDFYKINEDFSYSDYLKQLAFMPVLQNSNFLFDSFLKTIFGKENYDDIGVKSYEKIANFVINHSDIDTCNTDQLYDLGKMVDVDTDDIRLNYPENIKRILNLASINESFLWGHNFQEVDVRKCVENQDPIDTTSFMVTAGIPMILKTNSLRSYRVINTGLIDGQSIYNIQYFLTSINIDPFFWRSEYDLYIGDTLTNEIKMNNIIDWNNNKTNISSNLSAAKLDWDVDEGILETLYSYNLFKGIGLL
jgi:hypothetical protein